MATVNYSETTNIEREKANLLCLIKLTSNALIDQSFSATSLPILDDRNADVTNFILTLERVLCFRMRATWLSDRRYFWDFIRPACIGSCRQSIIERVEEISNSNSVKIKGRIWIKIALMEKKLSELLKLVISDCNLVQKFYYEDSIMLSSQAFILCDQLVGLNTIDFGFCFKQAATIIAPMLLNDVEIDVIDLIPFLHFKPKHQVFATHNNTEDNKEISSTETTDNPTDSSENNGVSLEKYKLEIEQRKYFEELLQHRDRQLQQLKIRYEILKGERENEVVQLENIILELQLELQSAREEVVAKNRRSQQFSAITPPRNPFYSENRKISTSPSIINNERTENNDQQMSSMESSLTNADHENFNFVEKPMTENQTDDISKPTSSTSSHSTISSITDDEQYESVSKISSNVNNDSNQTTNQDQTVSSPEIVSSANSIPPSSSSSASDEDKQMIEILTTDSSDENKQIIEILTIDPSEENKQITSESN